MKFSRRQLRTLIESLVLENSEEFESADYKYFSKAAELVQRLREVQKDLAEKTRKVYEQEKMIANLGYSSGGRGMMGAAAMGTGVPQSELKARRTLEEEASKEFDITFDELEKLGKQTFIANTAGDYMDDLTYGAGFSEEDLQVFEKIGWHKKSAEVKSALDENSTFKGKGFYVIREDLRRYNYPKHLQRKDSSSSILVLDALEGFIQKMLVPFPPKDEDEDDK